MTTEERALLRHVLATLAYRTTKALRGASPEFATFRAMDGVRTPHELVTHMGDVLTYALRRFEPLESPGSPGDRFEDACARFHDVLTRLSARLRDGDPIAPTSPARLLQGPLSDAMTHAGQLAMLRRLSGDPIPPESFHDADIDTENVSEQQAEAGAPAVAWHDAEGRAQDRRR